MSCPDGMEGSGTEFEDLINCEFRSVQESWISARPSRPSPAGTAVAVDMPHGLKENNNKSKRFHQ